MTNVSLPSLIISIPVFIFAIIIHEVAHGWVAYRLGDPTAKHLGRLTLNPIPHIDPIGTVVLPMLMIIMNSPVVFGWAKPVPINFLGLRNPKKDIIYVGLAGPLANIIFAFMLAALFRLFPVAHGSILAEVVFISILVNLFLAAFNLIPIPPLDGSRILFGLLPARLAVRYMTIEKYGFIILFILIWMGFLDWFVNPIVVILSKIIGA
jgi:Zn-dependent protease